MVLEIGYTEGEPSSEHILSTLAQPKRENRTTHAVRLHSLRKRLTGLKLGYAYLPR